jgi:hypothetical protein
MAHPTQSAGTFNSGYSPSYYNNVTAHFLL